MPNIILPAGIIDDIVRFTEVSSLTAKRALDEVETHRQCQQKAAALRPDLLKHMIAAGVISAKSEKTAAAMLGGHAETLSLLKAAVDKIVVLTGELNKQAGDSGQGVDPATLGLNGGTGHTKVAGEYDSLSDPFPGRHTNFVKESDKPLLALIGR